MDKYLIKTKQEPKSTLELLEDTFEPAAAEKKEMVIGFLGSSSSKEWNQNIILEKIIEPLLAEEGKAPDSVLLPSDGTTSLLLEVWAQKSKIPCSVITADWKKLGRRAQALRDQKIVKEANCLVFFKGVKSDFYEKMAIREAKKGRLVYTIEPDTRELVKWEI